MKSENAGIMAIFILLNLNENELSKDDNFIFQTVGLGSYPNPNYF